MMKIIIFSCLLLKNKQTKIIADFLKNIFFGHFHYETDITLLLYSKVSSGFLAKFLSDFKYILNILK